MPRRQSYPPTLANLRVNHCYICVMVSGGPRTSCERRCRGVWRLDPDAIFGVGMNAM